MYTYTREIELFFHAFKNLVPHDLQLKVMNNANLIPTSFDDFIHETEEVSKYDFSTICDHVKELDANKQLTIFQVIFDQLDVDSMNEAIKDTTYKIMDTDDLDSAITEAQNSLDDIKEVLNKLIGG